MGSAFNCRRTDIPEQFQSWASAADDMGGAFFAYDVDDIVLANGPGQRLYPDADWTGPVPFDECFWYGLRVGATQDQRIAANPDFHLQTVKAFRSISPAFRFQRRYGGTLFDRHHVRLDARWNAQLWLPVQDERRMSEFTLTPRSTAVDLQRHSVQERALARLMALVDGMGVCVGVVNAAGRMVDYTPSMVSFLSEANGLYLDEHDVLTCTSPPVTERLRASIAQIALGRLPATMVSVPVSGAAPLQVGLLASSPGDPCAIVAVSHSDDSDRFAEILREAYGLTPAEAEVAIQIGAGVQIDEIVAASGRSRHTVKAQVDSAKRKIGADRQHALAHLLTKAAAIVGGLRSAKH
ncbi:helix-turn-helix transcriptional regulator [Azospirillum agricola]|uniref:helix-turn-helix transcriptional regulator n=1 Tax=Azospirillum agricola TaxID=1720247 RepID=UPI000A0EF883|nr:helix-turn-helix transcriptional regulator [Azospirillum agricola]SMH56707.1 DNA-binding transcriptional regulator, CsgD family [Azospirillum lipoferum]